MAPSDLFTLRGGFWSARSLLHEVQVSIYLNNLEAQENSCRLCLASIRKANRSLRNLGVCAERIQRLQDAALVSLPGQQDWCRYLPLDIYYFHSMSRALLDHIAEAVSYSRIDLSNRVPESFSRLKKWVESESNRVKFGTALSDCFRDAQWFDDLRSIRDFLTHFGGNLVCFGAGKEGLLFQVYDAAVSERVQAPDMLLYNGRDVVYFDRYAAFYVREMLNTISSVSLLLSKHLNPSQIQPTEGDLALFEEMKYTSEAGFSQLNSWIVELERLESM